VEATRRCCRRPRQLGRHGDNSNTEFLRGALPAPGLQGLPKAAARPACCPADRRASLQFAIALLAGE
jgi:hypothetical protein